MSYERDLFTACFGTEDQKEGARALLEKRKPTYTGNNRRRRGPLSVEPVS
jgi:1,4-dihydroxy-2-naphthoyl-CoA synthase